MLLDVFWTGHAPTSPAVSRQYASLVFFHDEEQRRLAEASRERMRPRFGKVYTEVVPYTEFHLAEEYHQKYRLRSEPIIVHDFMRMYPSDPHLVHSTAAARVNGYLDGVGSPHRLLQEIDTFGLTSPARARLLERAGTSAVYAGRGGEK